MNIRSIWEKINFLKNRVFKIKIPEQTRRDVLRMLLGTAGAAASGLVFNGCATTLEARSEDTLPKNMLPGKKLGVKRKYDTMAHRFLDIEAEVDFESIDQNVSDSDYQVLDDIIDEAQKRVSRIKLDKLFTEYTREEAVNVLEAIGKVLEDHGFEYQNNLLLNQGLKNKKIDCDIYSVIYLGIADVLNLPLKAVSAPEHVFVRWHFDEDDYANWETTETKEYSNEYYISWLKIPEDSIKKGVFLRSLSRKEFCSEAYVGRGYTLNKLGRYEEAIESYDRAIELNPRSVLAYNNKGFVLSNLKRCEEALKNYDEALKLNPNYSRSLRNKKNLMKKDECLKKH